MGARPSSFKTGGGFLNNVDAVFADYEFTTDAPGGGKAKTKRSKSGDGDFTPGYVKISFKTDGASEVQQTSLYFGNAESFEISDDGKTLTPVEEGFGLSGNTEFARFIESLVMAGFPETNLPEDDINYEAIINWRMRLHQVVNEEATKKLGKQKNKKTGREYERRDLRVLDVYGPVETKTVGKGSSKSAVKAVTAKSGKANGASKSNNDEVEALAIDTLQTILNAAGANGLIKTKLPLAITKAITKHPLREDVRRLIMTDDFLGREEGWAYDQSEQMLIAVE